MPELPEVQALTTGLAERMAGRRIERCQVASFSALKTVDPPIDDLVGQIVVGVERRGKFVCIVCDRRSLVIHLARGGWIRWYDVLPATRAKPGRGPIALRLGFDDRSGMDVTEMGTEKRLALWVVGSPDEVAPLAALGPDPLGPDFTVERLAAVLRDIPATIKTALTTQSLIAGVGNAYSDEALHRAKLSPYKRANKLDAGEIARLHDGLVGALGKAVERSSGLALSEIKREKKRTMEVHGRTGEACSACGDTIAQVSFATKSMQYCPTCQTGGKPLADRRLSRLLK